MKKKIAVISGCCFYVLLWLVYTWYNFFSEKFLSTCTYLFCNTDMLEMILSAFFFLSRNILILPLILRIFSMDTEFWMDFFSFYHFKDIDPCLLDCTCFFPGKSKRFSLIFLCNISFPSPFDSF